MNKSLIFINVCLHSARVKWCIRMNHSSSASICADCLSGIIERAGGSMEEEIGHLRRSQPLEAGDFALSDAMYFYKRGLESIVDDEVTQRFSSEELASWNLLTRTNQNFCYISLRLTIIWGLGVFVRYCVLFPLRSVWDSRTSDLLWGMTCGKKQPCFQLPLPWEEPLISWDRPHRETDTVIVSLNKNQHSV